MRTHAPSSTRLAGASTAAVILTAAVAAILGSSFGGYLARVAPEPIAYVPPPKTVEPPPPNASDILPIDDITLTIPSPLPDDTVWVAEDDTLTGSTDNPPRTEQIVGYPGPTVIPSPPAVRRSAPKLLPGEAPPYPARDIREGNEGVTRLDVCVDVRGRVSSASLAASSGHQRLDDAALNWVRRARFTPGAVDGAARSVCGHTVSYEWKLVNAR
jgi:protein TonB